MDEKILNNFIDGMKGVMYRMGEFSLEHQGKVKNLRKQAEGLINDNDFTKQEREAKTAVDMKVQEELLKAALELFDVSEIYLDAEEETPSREKFSPEAKSTTLIIDPIDGTLRYLLGKDGFSICVGLAEKGEIIAALVYFPARKDFYFMKNSRVYCEAKGKLKELFAPKVKNETQLYMNLRVGAQVAGRLKDLGFSVINDGDGLISWLDALLGCIKGEYNACIFHTPQIRDILLGAMISKMPGGYALDWKGHKIVWPDGGRVPGIMFGFELMPKKLLGALR